MQAPVFFSLGDSFRSRFQNECGSNKAQIRGTRANGRLRYPSSKMVIIPSAQQTGALGTLHDYDRPLLNSKDSQFKRFENCCDACLRLCLTMALADVGVRLCALCKKKPTERRISM